MNLLTQIIAGLGIALVSGFAVYYATIRARKKAFSQYIQLIEALCEKRGYTTEPNSPTIVIYKLGESLRAIEQRNMDLSHEEKLLLLTLMVLTPWSDSIVGVVPPEDAI